ncbi:hypothetical protein OSB04_021145 [Centaurea solstitialis]|uniref:Reverse transcriptase Ty1/copia-type domain-containing protein n=1 Tax=Centaurea solstitialis TaxID=347529 RepID=A0AA38W4M3_9ASTR|nr:hypothetical protein OSB04_021145 [Centaurea solstitialis]
MSQPPGFVDPSFPHHVCKLNKAIYGLRQASRAWYNELKSFLISDHFKPTISDPSLFVRHSNTSPIYILVYVDDIIFTGPNSSLVSSFITSLAHKFSLKDLGNLSYFLGVEVLPHPHGLFLSQSKYILDLLTKANMNNCKPASIPLTISDHLTTTNGTPLSDPKNYRSFVGGLLQYLSLTRPDVAFVVNKLSQFMHRPTDIHWAALKRLHCATYSSCTTGYIVYLGSNPIAWSSKRQPTLARSSTKAEFWAVASTTTEVQWTISLLSELGYKSTTTPTIFCDNLSAVHYSANPVFHSRMKHLALDFHFVREKVQDGSIRVTHIKGDDQLADALTKPMAPADVFLPKKGGTWGDIISIKKDLGDIKIDLSSLVSLEIVPDQPVWRAQHHSLPTFDNLASRGVIPKLKIYPFCDSATESEDHLFLDCFIA